MGARHVEDSLIMSEDDNPGRPNDRLLNLAREAIWNTQKGFLATDIFEGRTGGGMEYHPETWPGEHYYFLPGLIQAIRHEKMGDPKSDAVFPSVSVIEIGTSSGQSAVAMLAALPYQEDSLNTFEICGPWNGRHDSIFTKLDFATGRLREHSLTDLTNPEIFEENRHIVEAADFIFIDAAKDGVCEPKLIALLNTCNFKSPPIVMFDDIRLMAMVWVWRGIDKPKLDITSFCHWTGSGLVEWVNK